MKVCSKCNVVLPLESFTLNKNMRDGHERTCKECRAVYRKTCTISEQTKERNRLYLKAHNAELVARRRVKRLAQRAEMAEERALERAKRLENRPRGKLKSRLRAQMGVEPPEDLIDLILAKCMLNRAIKESKYGTK